MRASMKFKIFLSHTYLFSISYRKNRYIDDNNDN